MKLRHPLTDATGWILVQSDLRKLNKAVEEMLRRQGEAETNYTMALWVSDRQVDGRPTQWWRHAILRRLRACQRLQSARDRLLDQILDGGRDLARAKEQREHDDLIASSRAVRERVAAAKSGAVVSGE